MKEKNKKKPIILKNPYDGKKYDLEPFFRFLNTQSSGHEDLIEGLSTSIELMPHLMSEKTNYLLLELQNSAFFLANLRDAIKETQL